MNNRLRSLCVCISLLWAVPMAHAQSGSGGRPSYQPRPFAPARTSQPPAGSEARGSEARGSGAFGPGTATVGPTGSDARSLAAEAVLAMRGFCPVTLATQKQWIAGDPRIFSVYDGHLYRFPDLRAKQIFDADPVRYAPALGGDNIVMYAKTGQRVPGNLSQGLVHGGRLFFVGTQQERDEFMQNEQMYADADLVLGGDCVVCQVHMGKTMPGVPQLTTTHKGLRYQFAGLEQQRTFLAAPTAFEQAVPTPGNGSGLRSDGSETRPSAMPRPGMPGPGMSGPATQGSGSQGSGGR